MSVWYVVMRMSGWGDIRMESNHPLLRRAEMRTTEDPSQPCAFLPVFATREAAVAWADGDESLVSTVARKEEC